YSPQLMGSPVVQNVLLVDFTSFSGIFILWVRESSFGCLGPASPADTIFVTPPPVVSISPPAIVCVGDTVQYTAPFANNTYWTWSLSTGIGTITDTTNNQVQVVFNSAGEDTLWCQALNSCGLTTAFRRITVRDYPLIAALSDTTVCSGSQVIFVAPASATVPPYQYVWRDGTTVISTNDSLIVSPTTTTVYTLSVSNGGICYSYDTVQVNMYPFPPIPTITQNGDSLICSITSGVSYQWFLNGVPQTQTTQYIIVTPADSGSWYVVVTDVDSPFCSTISATLQIPVGIIEMMYSDYLSVFPNPVTDELSITGYSFFAKAEITIYNTLGEKILSKEIAAGEKEVKLNVKNLPAGIYVVRITGEKTNLSSKFVKQ
ncbi:MAG TPA: T9SS type A sorting domain-containing protein, partial [Bacteroidia bacterium]|nr:T9SS type A sorting domain-containing protein [Bacteroidia bacterium]